MIYGFAAYDIISVPSYSEGIYHRTKCDIISKIYHPFRIGTDIIEAPSLRRVPQSRLFIVLSYEIYALCRRVSAHHYFGNNVEHLVVASAASG